MNTSTSKGGAALVALATAQFLMVLDQSVMNVSISQLVEGLPHHGDHDPGRHHPLLLGDGHAHPHRSQDRRHHRPQTSIRHRLDHLRLRLGAHRGVANGRRPRAGMVDPRRHRCRARLPRARRVDRRELRRNPTQSRLRGDRRRRRCGDRGRSHRGRVGDDRTRRGGSCSSARSSSPRSSCS